MPELMNRDSKCQLMIICVQSANYNSRHAIQSMRPIQIVWHAGVRQKKLFFLLLRRMATWRVAVIWQYDRFSQKPIR